MQTDIDMEWLKSQCFDVELERDADGEMAEGTYHVTGLLGIGSFGVVFDAIDPNGEPIALKLSVPRFAFYLRELPVDFRSPSHDVKRMNQKLSRLTGDPLVDLLVADYAQLYSNIFDTIRESNMTSVDKLKWNSVRSEVLMGFAMRTPGFRYRVQQRASGGNSKPEDAEWANAALKAIDRIVKTEPDLKPEELLENPFYVWGGAVIEGLFNSDDLPIAVSFLHDMFGPRSPDSQVDFWLNQTWIVGNLLQDLVDSPAVASFTEFHNLCNEMLTA